MRPWTTNWSVHYGLMAALAVHLTGVGLSGCSEMPFLAAAAQRQGEDGGEPHHGRRWVVGAWNLVGDGGEEQSGVELIRGNLQAWRGETGEGNEFGEELRRQERVMVAGEVPFTDDGYEESK
jgi:hypothetical protein